MEEFTWTAWYSAFTENLARLADDDMAVRESALARAKRLIMDGALAGPEAPNVSPLVCAAAARALERAATLKGDN